MQPRSSFKTISAGFINTPLPPRQRESANLVVGLFFVFAVLRIAISFEVLDRYFHYTSDGGSLLEKIHPAALGMIFTFIIIYLSWQLVCDTRDKPVATAAMWLILAEMALIALGIITGKMRGLSFSLDSILEGPLAAYLLVFIDDKSRRTIFRFLIFALVFNDLVLFFEFATHIRIGAYAAATREIGSYFRPAAFLGHPLINGAFNAAAVAFAWIMPWSMPKRTALSFFFLLAAFAAQARVASLLAVLVFVGCAWIVLQQMRRKRQVDEGAMAVFLVGTLTALAFALVVIAASGLADRLLGIGILNDKSSEARFTIYQIFDYLTWREMMFGVEKVWSNYLLTSVLGLTAVESWIVNGVLYFGIVGSVIVFPALFFFVWRLQTNSGSHFITLGVLCCLAVALQGNALTSKTPTLMFDTMIALSAIGSVRADRADSLARSRRRPANVPAGQRSIGASTIVPP